MLNVVQIQTIAIILVLSYFIGNFQTAVLFSKRFLHDDVRQHGSGNPGASNMTRVFGTKWGVLTFCGDAFKSKTAPWTLPWASISGAWAWCWATVGLCSMASKAARAWPASSPSCS